LSSFFSVAQLRVPHRVASEDWMRNNRGLLRPIAFQLTTVLAN